MESPEYLSVRAAKERVDQLQSEIAAFEGKVRDRGQALYEQLARSRAAASPHPALAPVPRMPTPQRVDPAARQPLAQGCGAFGPALAAGVLSPPSRVVPRPVAGSVPVAPPMPPMPAPAAGSPGAAAAASALYLEVRNAEIAAAGASAHLEGARSPLRHGGAPAGAAPSPHQHLLARPEWSRALDEQTARERRQADETIGRLLNAVQDMRARNSDATLRGLRGSSPPRAMSPAPRPSVSPHPPPQQRDLPPPPAPAPAPAAAAPAPAAAVPAPAPAAPAPAAADLRRLEQLAAECEQLRAANAKLEAVADELRGKLQEARAPASPIREETQPTGDRRRSGPRVSVTVSQGVPARDSQLGETPRGKKSSLSGRSPRASPTAGVSFDAQRVHSHERRVRHSPPPSPGGSETSGRRVAFIAGPHDGERTPPHCEKSKRIRELEAEVGRLRARGEQDANVRAPLSEALQRRAEASFAAVDAQCNKDGTISKPELLRVLREERLGAKVLFKELDVNSDNDVTIDEWVAWFERIEGAGRSAENMIEWIEERLQDIREHRHVGFAQEEPRVHSPAHRHMPKGLTERAEAAFAAVDAQCNKDGTVSKEELTRVLREEKLGAKVLFRELDANSDGDITIDEWMAWLNRLENLGRSAENMVEWIEDRLEAVQAERKHGLGGRKPSVTVCPPRPEVPADVRERALQCFEKVDAQCNKDGTVSKEELARVLKEERLGAKVLFKELDANSDGDVSQTEWLAWLERIEAAGRSAENMVEWIEERLQEVLTGTDSADELSLLRAENKRLREELAAFSADMDGYGQLCSPLITEYRGPLTDAHTQRAKSLFESIDALCNKDGSVSKDELLRVLQQERLGAKVLFRELDTNKDGDISTTEWIAWFDKLERANRSAENMLEWLEERLEQCAPRPAPPETRPRETPQRPAGAQCHYLSVLSQLPAPGEAPALAMAASIGSFGSMPAEARAAPAEDREAALERTVRDQRARIQELEARLQQQQQQQQAGAVPAQGPTPNGVGQGVALLRESHDIAGSGDSERGINLLEAAMAADQG